MDVHPSKLIAHCPVCQTSYGDQAIRLVGERGTSRLFHCTCASCGHAMLAVILENAGWVSSIGMITDLEANDAARFQKLEMISANECVQIHQGLEHQSRELCQQLLGMSHS